MMYYIIYINYIMNKNSKSKTFKKKLKKIYKISDKNIKLLVGGNDMQQYQEQNEMTNNNIVTTDEIEPPQTQQPMQQTQQPMQQTQQPIQQTQQPMQQTHQPIQPTQQPMQQTHQPMQQIQQQTQQPIQQTQQPIQQTQQPIQQTQQPIQQTQQQTIIESDLKNEDENDEYGVSQMDHQLISIPDELLGLDKKPEPGIIDEMSDYFKLFADAFQYKMLLIIGELSGIKGKTPEEVSKELKQNTEKLKKINEYFKNNPEVKQELQKTTDVVGEILSGSLKKIPDEFEESMNKLGKLAVKSGVDGLTEIPGANIPIATLKLGDDIAKISNESADVLKKTVNMIDDVLEETKEPIEDVIDKTKEIAVKAQEVDNATSQPLQTQLQPPPTTTSQPLQTQPLQPPTTTSQPPQTQTNEKIMMVGGASKTFKSLQTGGKKIRKRLNYTRNSFKRLAEKLTRKNR